MQRGLAAETGLCDDERSRVTDVFHDATVKGKRMDWNDRPVLVTGAGGFIGSHLVEALVRQGARVRAFLHYRMIGEWGLLDWVPPEIKAAVEVVSGDLRDVETVMRAVEGRDRVFHL